MQARQRVKKSLSWQEFWKAKGNREILWWNFEFWARCDAQGEIHEYL